MLTFFSVQQDGQFTDGSIYPTEQLSMMDFHADMSNVNGSIVGSDGTFCRDIESESVHEVWSAKSGFHPELSVLASTGVDSSSHEHGPTSGMDSCTKSSLINGLDSHNMPQSALRTGCPKRLSLRARVLSLHKSGGAVLPAKNNMHSLSKTVQPEAVQLMVNVMDACTHLANFSIPVDPRLAIIVAAQVDAYMPRLSVTALDKLWPGSELRVLRNQGHIGAFLFHSEAFR